MNPAHAKRTRRRLAVGPRIRALGLAATLLLVLAAPTLAENAGSADTTSPALSPSIAVSPGWDVSLGTEIVLDASTSDHGVPDERVDEVRYIWDLGDGTVQVGERITHRYTALGTFRIVLTMEVFEQSGVFHRRTSTADVAVTLAEFPRFVTVIDLETGYAQPGEYAVLFQIEDQYLLIGQQGSPTSLPSERPRAPFRLPTELGRLVLSGGLITVGDLRLWNGTVGMELAQDGWLASAGFGMSSSDTSVSLTHLSPVIASEGYDLVGVIERANLVSLGLCYEAAPNLYLLGSLGSLYVAGIYEGSSRLILDDELLPAPFSGRMATLSFGLGLRIGSVMLSLQALLTL
jgi:hypothetical protein